MPKTDSHFDLAIVGGGPAGAAAAITAARAGASVILFEAREFPRHKVCGEFVSAEALDLLADLLQDSAASSLIGSAPVMRRARLFLGSRMIEAPVSPPAVSITRYALDAALWETVKKAGAEAVANAEVVAVEGNGPFHLQTSSGSYTSAAVIIAAGRWSQFTPDRRVPAGPKWIGVKGHFREANPSASTDLYFFDGGYCGVQPVAPDIVNACAMVRSDRARSLAEVFALHPRLVRRAEKWTPVMQPVCTAPLIYRQGQPTRGSVMFVGDAAGFIDPFVGDGISIALRSGSAAATCLREAFSDGAALAGCVARYEEIYSRQFAPLLSAASRVRSLLSLPLPARSLAFELLRIPGLMPLVIRKTRRAS